MSKPVLKEKLFLKPPLLLNQLVRVESKKNSSNAQLDQQFLNLSLKLKQINIDCFVFQSK